MNNQIPQFSPDYGTACCCGECDICIPEICDCGHCDDCLEEDFVVPSHCDFFGDLVFNNGQKYS